MKEKKYIVGIYDDDEKLMSAISKIQERGIHIDDVFTPFPVHHLDEALHMRPSRLPDVGFVFGLLGTITALTMMTFMYTFDWQVNVGGKPVFPLPSFIPITFELTVLFCALGMMGVYLFVNKLKPGIQPEVVEPRQTDDRFVIIIETKGDDKDNNVKQAYKDTGAEEVREQYLEGKWYNI